MRFHQAREIVIQTFINNPLDLLLNNFLSEEQMKRRVFRRGVRQFEKEIQQMLLFTLQGSKT